MKYLDRFLLWRYKHRFFCGIVFQSVAASTFALICDRSAPHTFGYCFAWYLFFFLLPFTFMEDVLDDTGKALLDREKSSVNDG